MNPDVTLEGEPARAWCNLCIPPQAFKSLEECNQHMKQYYGRQHEHTDLQP